MSDANESVLVRKTGLTHIEIERRVEYFYCNEGELNSLKSTGFIQNITLSVGVGVIFFGIPLLIGMSSIQLDGQTSKSASMMVGWLSILVALVFFWLTYLLHNQG